MVRTKVMASGARQKVSKSIVCEGRGLRGAPGTQASVSRACATGKYNSYWLLGSNRAGFTFHALHMLNAQAMA